ncbi:homoserine kinase [Angustibacter aerolatus]
MVRVGGSARVLVPATSANLGPGFDSLGLALDLHDDVRATVVDGPTRVVAEGEGGDEVPDGDEHLVVRALRRALDAVGAEQPVGLHLVCRNAIPHGRGLGSSAAAVVAGVELARGLLPGASAAELDDDLALRVATSLEGHPDNAADALLGGGTVAWTDEHGPHAVRVEPHPELTALAAVPTSRLATHHARSVLPASVSHEDAAANVARTAVLVEALRARPDLLLAGTDDRLHQRQRAAAMPATLGLVHALRAQGAAAVVSGAGPTVLVLTTTDRLDADRAVAQRAVAGAEGDWRLLHLAVHRQGVVRVADPPTR